MDRDREILLGAAAEFLKRLVYDEQGKIRTHTWHPEAKLDLEEVLVANLERAKADLDGYRASRAFRTALDHLLPGWFDIDPSNFFRHRSGDFVSNDPREWFDYLVRRGVSPAKAKELLREQGHPFREGASRST